jgi:hypothetical protein
MARFTGDGIDNVIKSAAQKYFLTLKNSYNTGKENRTKKNISKARRMREVCVQPLTELSITAD